MRQAELIEPGRGDVLQSVFLAVAQALEIDRGQDGLDLLGEPECVIRRGERVAQWFCAQTVQCGPDLGQGAQLGIGGRIDTVTGQGRRQCGVKPDHSGGGQTGAGPLADHSQKLQPGRVLCQILEQRQIGHAHPVLDLFVGLLCGIGGRPQARPGQGIEQELLRPPSVAQLRLCLLRSSLPGVAADLGQGQIGLHRPQVPIVTQLCSRQRVLGGF